MIYQIEGSGEVAVSYSTSDGITSRTEHLDASYWEELDMKPEDVGLKEAEDGYGYTSDVPTGELNNRDALLFSATSLDGYGVTCRIILGGEVIAENYGQSVTCQG